MFQIHRKADILMLTWYKSEGKAQMAACRNNADKSKVWLQAADMLNKELNIRYAVLQKV